MQDQESAIPTNRKQTPWNKGKLTGAKPPLRPKHVWSIRTKLQIEGRVRDLAMFNLAIDSKLRGCNVVAVKVDDVAAGGIHRGSRNRTPEENFPSTAVIAACAACCCSAESAAKGSLLIGSSQLLKLATWRRERVGESFTAHRNCARLAQKPAAMLRSLAAPSRRTPPALHERLSSVNSERSLQDSVPRRILRIFPSS